MAKTPSGLLVDAVVGPWRVRTPLLTQTLLFLLWDIYELLKSLVGFPLPCPREGQASEGPITGHPGDKPRGHGTMTNFRLKKTVLTRNINTFDFIPLES